MYAVQQLLVKLSQPHVSFDTECYFSLSIQSHHGFSPALHSKKCERWNCAISYQSRLTVIDQINSPFYPGTITIHCEDIDLVGDIVQALAASLNIENMTSTANFPDFIEKLKEVRCFLTFQSLALLSVSNYRVLNNRIKTSHVVCLSARDWR